MDNPQSTTEQEFKPKEEKKEPMKTEEDLI
jgi:hypothetical protein